MDPNQPTMPGLNGGTLKRGNSVNVGKKRSEVRQACIDGFNAALPRLLEMVTSGKLKPHEYAKLVDLLGKYGLGSVQVNEITGEDGQALRVQYTFGPAKPVQCLTDASGATLSLIQPAETVLNTIDVEHAVDVEQLDTESTEPESPSTDANQLIRE